MKERILVVDDEELSLRATAMRLEEWGYIVDKAESGDKAIKIISAGKNEYKAIVMDFRMPNKNGAQTAAEIRKYNDESVILMYSADDSRVATRDSFKLGGAIDFIDKSPNIEILKNALIEACKKYEEISSFKHKEVPKTEVSKFLESIGLVSISEPMMEVGRKLILYQQKRITVLLVGETGTGKEVMARFLHSGPGKYETLNCASFNTGTLMENELCGHEKGSYTGADQRKAGILETANGGTVFFDELHRLEPKAQARLLRIFQEKAIRRVGGTHEYPVDFKIVAGVQPNIEELVRRDEFLSDLYHRINYFVIEIPPLRDRPEDIELLVEHFKNKFNKEFSTKKEILKSTIRVFENYSWPGNVRELDGVMCRLIGNPGPNKIGPELLKGEKVAAGTHKVVRISDYQSRTDKTFREYIVSNLENADTITHGAKLLGMAPSTLRSIMKRLNIEFSGKNKKKNPKSSPFDPPRPEGAPQM